MKSVILLFLILLSAHGHSQVDLVNNIQFSREVDSIKFSIWDVFTKEMMKLNEEGQEYEKELKRATLTYQDQALLIKNLGNAKSFKSATLSL